MKVIEGNTLNIRHFLILALGGTPFLHNMIEQMYKERQWEYYEHYRKSGFFDDPVISTYTTKSEERMREVVGIVEWCYHHNHFEPIERLIKKVSNLLITSSNRELGLISKNSIWLLPKKRRV